MQKELGKTPETQKSCPCGSAKNFDICCGRFIQGEDLPETPEELMRSRYCAFVIKDFEYLFETTDHQTRDMFDHKANELWADSVEFTGLEIINTSVEGTKGQVEFKAHFIEKGEPQVHHEYSRFRKSKGQWFFRDGKTKKDK